MDLEEVADIGSSLFVKVHIDIGCVFGGDSQCSMDCNGEK